VPLSKQQVSEHLPYTVTTSDPSDTPHHVATHVKDFLGLLPKEDPMSSNFSPVTLLLALLFFMCNTKPTP
jgi:hypothetical protein